MNYHVPQYAFFHSFHTSSLLSPYNPLSIFLR